MFEAAGSVSSGASGVSVASDSADAKTTCSAAGATGSGPFAARLGADALATADDRAAY
jgi:hypothetical protein